jgi:crotonobetaine/carnitine-CoA ligase
VLEAPGEPPGEPPPSGHGAAAPALVLFTSGTTGRSKGCLLSHRFAVRQAELMVRNFGLRADDVLYCPFPLFHLDATVMTVMPALVLGAVAAIGERFSASGFWPEVRAMGATVFDFMGATLTILHKRQSEVDDGDHRVRLGWGVPMPDFAAEFEDRFRVKLVEAYGSTDVGVPIYSDPALPRRPGSCGRPIPEYDVRIVDASDRPVPVGGVGEIVVRPNEPGLINDGYLGMPAESLAARRNLWFHTGDLARQDADGYVYFVGRLSDSIRRRGENISAFEVEEVVAAHPDILEAAAYGVPSDLTEEDVMVAVVPRPGRTVDPAALVAWCADRMARHMVPSYVDVVAALPKTPTEKVEKHALKARGVTPTTWSP